MINCVGKADECQRNTQKIGAKCPQVLQKIGAKCIWAKRLGAEYLLARGYNKGSCTYYVITFGGPERPLPPM